jgi:hypothetical protein
MSKAGFLWGSHSEKLPRPILGSGLQMARLKKGASLRLAPSGGEERFGKKKIILKG